VRGICVDRYAYGPWRCYDDGGRDVAGNFGHVLYAAKDGRACVLSSKSGRLVTEYAGSERTAPLGKRGERGRRRRLRRRRRRLSEGRWVDREDDDGRPAERPSCAESTEGAGAGRTELQSCGGPQQVGQTPSASGGDKWAKMLRARRIDDGGRNGFWRLVQQS
jgi:hypothetical protein